MVEGITRSLISPMGRSGMANLGILVLNLSQRPSQKRCGAFAPR